MVHKYFALFGIIFVFFASRTFANQVTIEVANKSCPIIPSDQVKFTFIDKFEASENLIPTFGNIAIVPLELGFIKKEIVSTTKMPILDKVSYMAIELGGINSLILLSSIYIEFKNDVVISKIHLELACDNKNMPNAMSSIDLKLYDDKENPIILTEGQSENKKKLIKKSQCFLTN